MHGVTFYLEVGLLDDADPQLRPVLRGRTQRSPALSVRQNVVHDHLHSGKSVGGGVRDTFVTLWLPVNVKNTFESKRQGDFDTGDVKSLESIFD